MQRRLSHMEPSPAEKERLEKKRTRHARNAFRAVGKRVSTERKQTFEYVDCKFSNMSLREAVFDESGMEALFEHFKRVDVADIRSKDDEIRTGKLGEYVVFGCLVKKHSKKETKTGSKYAVWSVCNMPRGSLPGGQTPDPTVVTMLLFEEAFQHLHTQTEGCVYAFRKPNLLPPRGGGGKKREVGHGQFSGHCLRISKKDQAIFLGICKDFKLCEAGGPNLSTCGTWYDANRMAMCPRHSQLKRRMLTSGKRMDVNNAERPGLSHHAVRLDLAAPVHISEWQRLGTERYGDNDDTFDEDAQRKKEKDKTLAKRLSNKRCSGAAKLQHEVLPKRPRVVANPMRKDISNIVTRAQMQPSCQAMKKKTGQHQLGVSMQQKCQKAIETLVKCGYMLHRDGSLTPPKSNTDKPFLGEGRNLSNAHGLCRATSTTRLETNSSTVEATKLSSSGEERACSGNDKTEHEFDDKEDRRSGEESGAGMNKGGAVQGSEAAKAVVETRSGQGGRSSSSAIEEAGGDMVELSDESEN